MDKKITISFVVATFFLLAGGIWFLNVQGSKEQARLNEPSLGVEIPSQGAQHIARGVSHPPYNSNPPTSGWHWGDGVAGPGIKDKEIPDELVLHSMEHGAVIVWYKDNLPKDDVEKIKSAFNNASGKKIMIPRKNLDVPVALTSWGWILELKTIDEVKIKEFIEIRSDRAPEKASI